MRRIIPTFRIRFDSLDHSYYNDGDFERLSTKDNKLRFQEVLHLSGVALFDQPARLYGQVQRICDRQET